MRAGSDSPPASGVRVFVDTKDGQSSTDFSGGDVNFEICRNTGTLIVSRAGVPFFVFANGCWQAALKFEPREEG